MTFGFISPSGNNAIIHIKSVGLRHLIDVGWDRCPPSREDEQAAEMAARGFLELMIGQPTRVVESKTFTDTRREAWEQMGRDFLKKGMQ